MIIRRANNNDLDGINSLLRQVLDVHHAGRPDIFKSDAKKYTDEEILLLIESDERPIFVAVDRKNKVLGYAFCMFIQHKNNDILTDIKTLYIDDLCVDSHHRGKHIGKALYEHVAAFAKESGCYNLTLNVWACNVGAIKFYEKCGLIPQKIGMEKIL